MIHQMKLKKYLALITLILIFPLSAIAQENPNALVEQMVGAGMADMPDMIPIAKCESNFRQFLSDGSVLRGGPSKQYLGIFQIDERIHTPAAKSMAYDLHAIEGNIAYARYLYSKSGVNPWKNCAQSTQQSAEQAIKQSEVLATNVSFAGPITKNLNFGMSDAQVRIVQQKLNANGFIISASGAGSSGNETDYFGGLTREAVKKFQCSKGIICSGTEASTGFGRVGPKTRAALNSF
jgi:hypothetical protein